MAKELCKWLARAGAAMLYIEPGSPWENGYCDSFNSKMREKFLNGEIFDSLNEVQVLAEGGESTTTPSGLTPRWDIAHQRQLPM